MHATFHYVGPLCSGYHGNHTDNKEEIPNWPISRSLSSHNSMCCYPIHAVWYVMFHHITAAKTTYIEHGIISISSRWSSSSEVDGIWTCATLEIKYAAHLLQSFVHNQSHRQNNNFRLLHNTHNTNLPTQNIVIYFKLLVFELVRLLKSSMQLIYCNCSYTTKSYRQNNNFKFNQTQMMLVWSELWK